MIAFVALFVAGCGNKKMSDEKVNTVKTGDIVSIALDENQSIPYRWRCEISDDSLIALTDEKIVNTFPPRIASGAGGERHDFFFEALQAGECSIYLYYTHIDDEEDRSSTPTTYSIVIKD